jgi:prepilin-type N-terminal cleavage/methylation domain-containing protein
MRKHKGFTLVELVVVVMILGILAAVAAPKLLGTSSAATDNGIKQTLAVVRDAIERYAAENGGQLPAQGSTDQTAFKTALAPYLRGAFPTCPVAGKNSDVAMTNVAGPITVGGSQSWHYNSADGQFIVNSNAPTTSDPTINYNQL